MFNGFPRPIPDSGGVIKSVQRGVSTIAASTASTTVPISTVDPDKSIIEITFIGAVTASAQVSTPAAEITDSNTITFNRDGVHSSVITIAWVVYEFANVKSKQTGLKVMTTTSDTQIVSPVNTSKTMFYATNSNNAAGTDYNACLLRYHLTNGTTITFNQLNAVTRNIKWQLLEFA